MTTRTLRFLLASLLAIASCTAGDGAQRAATVLNTDSAGVHIVYNADAALDTAATQLVEVLRIGEIDGPEEYQFHIVRDIALDDEGRLFLSNEGSKTIRVYSSDGHFLKQFGGPGSGPGEFRRMVVMPVLWKDTIFAYDPDLHQASLFDTTGVLLASFRYGFSRWGELSVVAATERGWLVSPYVLRPYSEAAAVGKALQDTARLALMHPDRLVRNANLSMVSLDSTLRPIVAYARGRIFGMLAREGGEGPVGVLLNPPFFEPQPSSRVSRHGTIFVARGFPYVVDVFDLDGRHIRSIRRAHQAVPITDAHIDRLLEHVNAHYDTIGGREMNLRRTYQKRATFPRVGFLPVTGRMVTDDDGSVWVQRLDIVDNPVDVEWRRGPPGPSHWDVFDPSGVFTRIVRFPPGFTLRAVRGSLAFGVGRDAFGVQYIVAYRVTSTHPD